MWTNKYDPVMTCQPLGVPRQGPPRRIYQSESDITFLFLEAMPAADTASISDPDRWPERTKEAEFDITYGEYGGTLGGHNVLDSIAFIDTTWLGRGGFLRSDACRERFTRQGDAILYDVTVEDPVLLEPWVLPTRTLAQHESQRGPSARARQLRNEFRDRSGRHADSALAGATSSLVASSVSGGLCASGRR